MSGPKSANIMVVSCARKEKIIDVLKGCYELRCMAQTAVY